MGVLTLDVLPVAGILTLDALSLPSPKFHVFEALSVVAPLVFAPEMEVELDVSEVELAFSAPSACEGTFAVPGIFGSAPLVPLL